MIPHNDNVAVSLCFQGIPLESHFDDCVLGYLPQKNKISFSTSYGYLVIQRFQNNMKIDRFFGPNPDLLRGNLKTNHLIEFTPVLSEIYECSHEYYETHGRSWIYDGVKIDVLKAMDLIFRDSTRLYTIISLKTGLRYKIRFIVYDQGNPSIISVKFTRNIPP